MTLFSTILSNARPFALIAITSASLLLAGCGGGGGGGDDGDDPQPQITQLTAPGMAELDGVVFGDNVDVTSRTDLAPHVGDFAVSATQQGPNSLVAYFSFDTSAIPAGATVRSAKLRITSDFTIGAPTAMMALARVDHVNYGNVFPQTKLGAVGLDFNFATLDDLETLGTMEIDVTEQLQADLDAGRSTSQYRLRGAIASNLDDEHDAVRFIDSEDATQSGQAPVILIEIELP